ncbi:hypothetical protein NPIL_601121, partial [Nephila pilipes]
MWEETYLFIAALPFADNKAISTLNKGMMGHGFRKEDSSNIYKHSLTIVLVDKR